MRDNPGIVQRIYKMDEFGAMVDSSSKRTTIEELTHGGLARVVQIILNDAGYDYPFIALVEVDQRPRID